MKRICSEAMGLSEFDEDTFKAQIDHVGIPVRGTVIVYFKDGHTFHGTWSTKKIMPPLSEERKRLIGEASKRYWRERKCQM